MNNRYLKKILCALSCAALTALFITVLFFAAPKIAAVPDTTGREITEINRAPDGSTKTVTYTAGKDFAAVSLIDLTDLGKITKVNYVADKFVKAGHLSSDMQIVDLSKPFEFAEKGTLIFVVMNLDPWDIDNFLPYSEKLAPYKIGEYWQFTISLPAVFSASNIYRGAELIARNGDIADYSFIEHCNFTYTTDKFVGKTKPTDIVLKLSTSQRALNNVIVTVHYQSSGGLYSGIKDMPLIGTDKAVTGVNLTSQNLLLSFAIIAAVVLAVLVVLSVVERSKIFAYAIIWVFGITALLLCRYFLKVLTDAPLFWSALSLAIPFVILGGAQLAVGKNFGRIPAKYLFPVLSSIGSLFAFILPFISFGAASAMSIVCTVIMYFGAIALIAFIACALWDKKDTHDVLQTCCTSVIAVGMTASLLLPHIFPAQINPLFWVCVATTVLTFFSVITVIMNMKKSNVYLTQNLHLEVERQVKDIKAVISERDKLLTFVSHDMRKPLIASSSLIDTLIERERDAEQTKALNIVKQNTTRVINDLSEIAAYAKYNYIAEPSQIVELCGLCAELFEFYKSDCNANGVILKNLVDDNSKAFVKKQGLENVVSNIIINALEHANCSTITISVRKDKNYVVLAIADNGKGIDADLDVFAPYVSENDNETGGVGLYICKNIIESMNGDLTYETGQTGTTFYISLLKA